MSTTYKTQADTIPCRYVDLSEPDQLDFMLRAAVSRRHLSLGQRALIAARIKGFFAEANAKKRREGGRRGGQSAGKLPANLPEANGNDSRDQAGEASGVSGKSVDHGSKVIDQGVPGLIAAVESGKISVSAAAKIADEPKAEQRKILRGLLFDPRRSNKRHDDRHEQHHNADDGPNAHSTDPGTPARLSGRIAGANVTRPESRPARRFTQPRYSPRWPAGVSAEPGSVKHARKTRLDSARGRGTLAGDKASSVSVRRVQPGGPGTLTV